MDPRTAAAIRSLVSTLACTLVLAFAGFWAGLSLFPDRERDATANAISKLGIVIATGTGGLAGAICGLTAVIAHAVKDRDLGQ